jgi:hypothetical protein
MLSWDASGNAGSGDISCRFCLFLRGQFDGDWDAYEVAHCVCVWDLGSFCD